MRAGSAAGTTTYAYDARDRLIEVCFQASCAGGGDPFIRWTYDGVGNRLTQARPTGTTSYSYNAADELTQAGSTAYTYDANGNQKTAGATTLTYDLANRLKTHAAGSTTTTYSYDGDGVRRQASTGSQASKKTNFLWDQSHGLPQVALERDGNNALLRRYVYGKRRISMTSGGSASYYHHDHLGSVANLTSLAGATQWTWAYEPYGATRTETKASGTQPTNFMKFTGEYADPTGLYHLRARQFDPTTSRFLARDPVASSKDSPSVSLYAYVTNRPTVSVDPSGMTGVSSARGQVAAFEVASPARAGGPCRIYASDPRRTGRIIWGTGWQRCRVAARFETTVCLQYRRSALWGLVTYWLDVDCDTAGGQTPRTTTIYIDGECKNGKHTYRIATYGNYVLLVPPPRGDAAAGHGSVQSDNYLTTTC